MDCLAFCEMRAILRVGDLAPSAFVSKFVAKAQNPIIGDVLFIFFFFFFFFLPSSFCMFFSVWMREMLLWLLRAVGRYLKKGQQFY